MNLTIRDLHKSYGGLRVLDGLSLSLESGRIYCLMGPSGSGKTTLLRILMGLEQADRGEILWDGHGPSAAATPRFSAVFQEDRLCEAFTPVENVMMVTGRRFTKAQVRAELCRLLPQESLVRPAATLSGGMKRRTAICRALLAPFDVLLMDEPFTGLDDATRQTVITYIREKTAGRLTLISTHQEEDVRLLNARLLTLRRQDG